MVSRAPAVSTVGAASELGVRKFRLVLFLKPPVFDICGTACLRAWPFVLECATDSSDSPQPTPSDGRARPCMEHSCAPLILLFLSMGALLSLRCPRRAAVLVEEELVAAFWNSEPLGLSGPPAGETLDWPPGTDAHALARHEEELRESLLERLERAAQEQERLWILANWDLFHPPGLCSCPLCDD